MSKTNQPDGFKSMQPCDWFEDKVKFPCIVQPKLDGVASFNRHGNFLGRSLKAHDNKFITELFSKSEYHGFCGEMIATELGPMHPDVCRRTSGDLRRIEGEPDMTWYIFDYVTEETKNWSYDLRMGLAYSILHVGKTCFGFKNIHLVDSNLVENMQQLLELEERYLDMGYEGIIIRDPIQPYKYGRCGKTFMGAWRVKRFISFEILVDRITEGNHNANEAKTNELGRTERSTHQENMQPNGLLGNIIGHTLADIFDPQSEKLLIPKGTEVTISPGEMDHKQRKHFWDNPDEIVKHIVTGKMFPKGVKDKPRFPTYVSHRNPNDF